MSSRNELISNLESIEQEVEHFCHGVVAPTADEVPFIFWLRDNFLPRERRLMNETSMTWSVSHVAKMTKKATEYLPQLANLSVLIKYYSQMIETDINLSRPTSLSFPDDLVSLLDEMEAEMKAIGYWTSREIDLHDLEDPRFLFPDRYLQFIYLPKERERIKRNDLSKDALHSTWALANGTAAEFLAIPKARRLFHLLLTYIRNATKNAPEQYTIDLDHNETYLPPRLWLVTMNSNVVDQAFEEQYLKAQSSLKIKSFKRGKAPMSAIREHFKAEPPSDVMNSLLQYFQQAFNSTSDHFFGMNILCTLEPIQEGATLRFFVIANFNLQTLNEKLPDLNAQEL